MTHRSSKWSEQALGGTGKLGNRIAPALIVGASLVFTFWSVWDNWAPDLSALYMAAKFFSLGEYDQIYAAPPQFFGPHIPLRWQELVEQLGHGRDQALPYAYPPLWAALFAPLARALDPTQFFNLFYTVQVPMMGGMVWLGWRLMQPSRLTPVVWALLSVVLMQTSFIPLFALYHDQPQITVTFLTLLAMERLLAGQSRWAGIALAVAATIKITPAMFVLVFVLRRDWRAFWAFVAAGGALTLASFVLAGPDLHQVYLQRIAQIGATIPAMNVNWSLEPVLYQLSLLAQGESFTRNAWSANIWAEPAWITITMRLILIALLGAAVVLARRLAPREQVRLLTPSLLIIVAVTGPLGWTHYYLGVIFLLPGLIGVFRGPAGPVLFLVFALLFNKSVSLALHQIESPFYIPMLVGVATVLALLGAFFFKMARSRPA